VYRRHRFGSSGLIALALGGMAGGIADGVHAQDSDAVDGASGARLEEVVVTARKRSEEMQNVPIAMSAITSASIAELGSPDLSDLGNGLPNVILDPAPGYANATAFSIRGMSFQDPDPTFEPAVGIVLDGVFLGKANASLLDLYDVERVEVLRGPQGTLFGKNTIGGLINVKSKRPSGRFGAGVELTTGNYGRFDGRGYIETPVGNSGLSVRLSALVKTMDGFFYNEFKKADAGKEDTKSARLSIVYAPTDANFDLSLVLDTNRDKGDQSPQRNASPPGYAAAQLGYPALTNPDLFVVRENADTYINSTAHGAMLEWNWDIGSHTLTSISGFRWTDDSSLLDLDGDQITLFEYPRSLVEQQVSEEVRLASTWSDTFDYVVGALYFRQTHRQNANQIADCALLALCPGLPAGVVALPLQSVSRQTGDAAAFFAQGNYHVTPALRITAGGRYSWEKKDFSLHPPGYNLAPPEFAPYVEADESFDDFSPKLGFDYKLAPDQMVYASYSKGFKAGGFNGRSNTITGIGPYDPEEVTAYEVGYKGEWLDNRVRTNLAIFYNEYTDMQVEAIVASEVGPGQETLVKNVGNAKTQGAELEGTAIVSPQFRVDFAVGYLDAKYTDFFADLYGTGTPIDNTDLKLRRAPKWTGHISPSYEQSFSFGTLKAAVDVSYSDEYETDVTNDDFARREAATLIGAYLTWVNPGDRFRVTLYGENLSDEQFIANGISAGGLFAFNQPNRPRVYGVKFGFDY
jgi:iron complex outermembrane receptor protein